MALPALAHRTPPSPRSSAIVDPRIGDLGPALLALEDGSIFAGVAFGAPVAGGGDLVVNTSQTGYQEVCTDPSYAGQVVVMTYPADRELRAPRGRRPVGPAVAPRPCRLECHRRGARRRAPAGPRSCATTGIPAIAGVDTRALARHLRANGSLRGIVRARRARPGRRRRARRGPCRAGRTRTSSPRSRPPR